MKKHQYNKMGLFACVTALVVYAQVCAAGLAGASGTLADVAVLATQSSAGLAAAANSGDVGAIADAQKRVAAIDAAMAEAQEAYAAMERAVAGGDDDAASAASDDLKIAWQKASDALNGAVPKASPQGAHARWKESGKNTGGGPGRANDPPNIYDDPSHSPNMRALYQDLFGAILGSSHRNGGDLETDATRE